MSRDPKHTTYEALDVCLLQLEALARVSEVRRHTRRMLDADFLNVLYHAAALERGTRPIGVGPLLYHLCLRHAAKWGKKVPRELQNARVGRFVMRSNSPISTINASTFSTVEVPHFV